MRAPPAWTKVLIEVCRFCLVVAILTLVLMREFDAATAYGIMFLVLDAWGD